MPRLFTGIQLPGDIVARLTMLCFGLPEARWIEPSNFHITLTFIGDIDNQQAISVASSLENIDHHQFPLSLHGLDFFGSKKPRLLYAKIRGSDPLSCLQQKHNQLIRQLGLPVEKRNFVPHVTLARFRTANTRTLAQYLAANGGFETEPFVAERFALYSARESIGGGPYVVEKTYPLNP